MCPRRDLTLTPRQRIVVRRAAETARERGDAALAAELDDDDDYDGVQTCAVDGMCQTACPVLINTGALVKRLRREDARPPATGAWHAASAAWGPVTRAGSLALSVAKKLPAPLVAGATDVGRAVLGRETVPKYSAELPAGGRSRRRRTGTVGAAGATPIGVYVPACVNSMFGPVGDGVGVTEAFVSVVGRSGLALTVPDGVESLCCGTPWSSKGFSGGAEVNRRRTVTAIVAATEGGRLPVIVDASSCTEGFAGMLRDEGVSVVDAVSFVARHVLPRVTATPVSDSLVLHPTCSSVQLGIDADMLAVGAAVARDVTVPDAWGCCAFAGDRGMLHPELTASATKHEAAEVAAIGADAHASCNRTCELGMTRATGRDYQHVIELLEQASR